MLNAQAAQNASIVGQGMANRIGEQNAAQQNYSSALNNMGSAAANMTNQQQSIGQFQYAQGQNALNFGAQGVANQQAVNASNAANIYNARSGNLAAQTTANAAQAQNLGHTVSSVAGFMAGGA
jgi:hypothetical protein